MAKGKQATSRLRKRYANTAHDLASERGPADRLHGRSKQIVEVVLSSIEDGNVCSLDRLASRFETTPERLRMSLRGPIRIGLLTINGELIVSPTVKLLQGHDSQLSNEGAAEIIRRISRG